MDFFEHVDEGFGLGEVGIGMEAGFDEPKFEEFFGDNGEIGAGLIGFQLEFGNLFAEGALVAFGFAGVFADAEAAQGGFARENVCADGRRTEEAILNFCEGMFFQKTEDEGLDGGMGVVETTATGRAEEIKEGEAIFGFTAIGGIGKKTAFDQEFGGVIDVVDFGHFGFDGFELFFFCLEFRNFGVF